MVDLKAKPFFLDDEQIAWVKATRDGMSLNEKLGQLFVAMTYAPGVDEARIRAEIEAGHPGGLRWQRKRAREAYEQNRLYQKHSPVPMFIAANCDAGGDECVPEGSFIATASEAAAGGDPETAYRVGLASAREAGSIGVNWLFNPVCDIYMNWRNTIVNARSYGSDPDRVLDMTRAYIRGVHDSGFPMLCTAKHFPGDGVDERDQHLLIACNDLSAGEWENSFGKVYRGLIDEGVETIMVGHIRQRALSKKMNPALRDEDILPATFSPELLQGVLRKELGFNGLIITDATQMIGFASAMPRKEALPAAINAGCDMILFANDMAEDLAWLRAAVADGTLSEACLDEALTRILGMKAKLGLHRGAGFPEPDMMDQYIGCDEHARFREEAAQRCATLVKDTQGLVPVDPAGKRVLLVYEHNVPNSRAYKGDHVREVLREELERAGFTVDIWPNFYDLEAERGVDFKNFMQMMNRGPRTPFVERYDLVLLALNYDGFAQTSEMRVTWSLPHGKDQPWYIAEVPTAVVSLKYTNHLNDVPQAKTYINAYGSSRENIRAVVEKLTGKSAFTGQADETVFCGRWDTRL